MSKNTKKFNAGVDGVRSYVNNGADIAIDFTAQQLANLTKLGVHVTTGVIGGVTKIAGDTTIVVGETAYNIGKKLVAGIQAGKTVAKVISATNTAVESVKTKMSQTVVPPVVMTPVVNSEPIL